MVPIQTDFFFLLLRIHREKPKSLKKQAKLSYGPQFEKFYSSVAHKMRIIFEFFHSHQVKKEDVERLCKVRLCSDFVKGEVCQKKCRYLHDLALFYAIKIVINPYFKTKFCPLLMQHNPWFCPFLHENQPAGVNFQSFSTSASSVPMRIYSVYSERPSDFKRLEELSDVDYDQTLDSLEKGLLPTRK